MKSGLTLLALLLCLPSLVKASIEPAVVVTRSGDTLQGHIDHLQWTATPNTFRFTQDSGETFTTYDHRTARSFTVADRHFRSGKISYYIRLHRTEGKGVVFEPVSDSTHSFAEALILGPKALYFHRTKMGKLHYYIPSDQGFKYLGYWDESINVEGYKIRNEILHYRTALLEYFDYCNDIRDLLDETLYRSHSLMSVFKVYYAKCLNQSPSYERTLERIALKYGLLAGWTDNALSFDGTNDPHLTGFPIGNVQSLTAGLSMEMIFPHYKRRWSMQNELMFAYYNFQFNHSHFSLYRGEPSQTDSEVTLSYSYIKLNNMFRFDLLTTGIRPFLSAGLSNGLVLTVKNQHDWVNAQKGDGGGRALDEPKHYEQGILYGMGIDWKHFSVEWRMDHGSGMSNSMSLGSYLVRNSILLHYKF